MRRYVALHTIALAATLAATLAGHAAAQTPPPRHAGLEGPARKAPTLRSAAARQQALLVASRDEARGQPALLWGQRGVASTLPSTASSAEHARAHLEAHAELYGVDSDALASAEVRAVHDLGSGPIVVTFRQRVDGVEVFHDDTKVLLRRDGALVAIGGHPHPDAASGRIKGGFALQPTDAVLGAALDLHGVQLDPQALLAVPQPAGSQWQRFDLATPAAAAASGLRFTRPARLRPVLFPMGDRLVPAVYVELFTQIEDRGTPVDFAWVLAADDGRVLFRKDLVSHENYTYRVWADPAGDKRPHDGPLADFTPHPTGTPGGAAPGYVPSNLVTIDGFNAPGDPWLPQGATETNGNNVDAYTDHANDGFTAEDVRGVVTSPNTFDVAYDHNLDPVANDDQGRAGVISAFYTTNWLHDYWYDSGFDEAAGNAQLDNYGKPGEAGDPLEARMQAAENNGNMNNANMTTPADGESPVMRMYSWSGPSSRSLTLQPVNTELEINGAAFGAFNFDVTAEMVMVDDGTAPNNDACTPVLNDVAGKIAVAYRGGCTFVIKGAEAQAAGAIALVVINNAPGYPGLGGADPSITIPVVGLTDVDGAALVALLANGPVTGVLEGEAAPRREGGLDNNVVAHEWGHYLHHRLVSCGMLQCGAMSEGWGDFVALTTSIRAGDNLDGAFPMAYYGTGSDPDSDYFGIRRMPYSLDPTKNSLTFTHMQAGVDLPDTAPYVLPAIENEEEHNSGEIWASMLFEGYVRLLKASQGPNPSYTFDEARRRMADYVVAGMKLAPPETTYLEQRDAILAAAFAADPADGLLLAQGFAARGAGSCAEGPPRDTTDNVGVVEDFDLAPRIALAAATINDAEYSCDNDGILDDAEVGELTFTITNAGSVATANTAITLGSANGGLTFPDGTDIAVGALEPLEALEITVPVMIDATVDLSGGAALTVTATEATACEPTVEISQLFRVDYDIVEDSSATDDFEGGQGVWTPEGGAAADVWHLEQLENGIDHAWHGLDVSGVTDTSLVSPVLTVGAGNLGLSFTHRFKFETSFEIPDDPTSPATYWDGGVLEYRVGGGEWTDVATIIDPGYGGVLGNTADNPLMDRSAFVYQNPSWPGTDVVTLDLGASFANQNIEVRYRIGTDQASSDFGWEIDDVTFTGIVGTPFPTAVADATVCMAQGMPPAADAGPDATVAEGTAVELDASNSSDPDGDALTFEWAQSGGPLVGLGGTTTAKADFTAPDVDEDTVLTFEVTVTSADGTDTDSVSITVTPQGTTSTTSSSAGAGGGGVGGSGAGAGDVGPTGSGDPGDPDFGGLAAEGEGCSCRTTPTAPGGAGALAGLAVAALAFRRRRRR